MKTYSFFAALFILCSCTSPSLAKPLHLGVIADVNGSACQTQYPASSLKAFDQLINNHPIDQIIMPGDAVHGECMNYSGSLPYQSVVRNMWEEFDKKFFQKAKEVKGVNVILAPGNHDAPFLFSGGRENFRIENAEFSRYWLNLKSHLDVEILQLPNVNDNYPYYWAYTYENVLFLVLQSTRTHSLSNGTEQKRWLRAVLDSPRAQTARAKIAFGHVPPYAVLDPSVGGKYSEIIENEQVGMPNSLMDLLLDKNVDLLISGHSHAPYPAELTRNSDNKRMKILSMPCGHAPRKLYSRKDLAPRGYAVLEIGDEGQFKISIRNFSDGSPIPSTYFPKSIPQKDAKVSYNLLRDIAQH